MIRAEFEHVEAQAEVSWKCFRRREDEFAFTWHFHPEYELALITEGSGTCFAGDGITAYEVGSLILIGPDLPHTYTSTGPSMHEAVVAQFREEFLGSRAWLDQAEFREVAVLLSHSRRGLLFPAFSYELSRFAEIDRMPPPERTIQLLSTLVSLSRSHAGQWLASPNHVPTLNRGTRQRTQALLQFLGDHYTEQIDLPSIAAAAHMSPAAASRLFRRTTGMTITGYLNLIRVSMACRLLTESERSVAAVAADVGYENLSNFNRRFRELKQMAPREYRARFAAGTAAGSDRSS